jgi:hypothetical protein
MINKRGYRVVTDVPQGICVGFEPEGYECDSWDLDDRGGRNVFYMDTYIIISDKETLEGEKGANDFVSWPADLMVWRSGLEFEKWEREMK